MNYSSTIRYMYSQLPMFHRIGSAAYKANLDNTYAICKLLGNPQHLFKTIHIAGTNGKGSTSHLIASVLQSAGWKVGLYTSPHLRDFRERIKINGKMIDRNYVIRFVGKYRGHFDKIQPSFFEMTVGLAFDYFARKKVDIAIIETGLGGRLDSTNILQPLISVITNISLDHQNLLGDTRSAIAREKAGIIKEGVPVVIGETQKEIRSVFLKKALACHSEIYFADHFYKVRNVENVSLHGHLYFTADVFRGSELFKRKMHCELPGLYQKKNIPAVLMTMELLNRSGKWVSKTQLFNGIKKVISNTGLFGRWQILSQEPLTIVDTGHNEAGMAEVLRQIKRTPHRHLHFVLGVVSDKDISKILEMLPKTACYYFCKPDIPRGLEQKILMKRAKMAGLSGEAYSSVSAALKAAKKNALKEDLIFAGGSTYVVAEIV